MSKKLMMVVNEDRFFLSHRKSLALAAHSQGWEVTIVCKDTGRRSEVEALGLPMLCLPINPTGMNLLQEARTFFFLLRLFLCRRPDVVHLVGLKSILWGGLAARLTRVHGVVHAVSGLGVLFNSEQLSRVARLMLRFMAFSNHRPRVSVIFQNQEDYQLFLSRGVVSSCQCSFIKGSGIDLDEYAYVAPTITAPLRVLFTARMVREKGVLTLIAAAQRLRSRYEGKVEFLLCGDLSNNPNGISRNQLNELCDGHYIQWLGFRLDVPQLLRDCHIVAFPSYYREGVPRSLIEACGVGRPIITCRSIGCKDVVDDGVNGFLIEPRDEVALADRLCQLLDNPDLRLRMGLAGRQKAEREFDVHLVEQAHLAIYESVSR